MLQIQPEDLTALADRVAEAFLDDRESIISTLYAKGKLNDFLELVDMKKIANDITSAQKVKSKKILVVGESSGGTERDYKNAAMELGIDPNDIELHLDFHDGKKMDFEKYKNNSNYCAIMVGPMPHNGKSQGDYSSVIAMLEHEEGYPKLVKLGRNVLKLTVGSFQCGLAFLASEGIIG